MGASHMSKSEHSCRNSSGRSPFIQSRPLSLQLCHFWSPKERLWGVNNSPQMMTSSSMCRTGSQCSPRNFTRQPFTTLCCSGTSASTARANASDIQVLVSVPRPPARFFLNAPHILLLRKATVFWLKIFTYFHFISICLSDAHLWVRLSYYLF